MKLIASFALTLTLGLTFFSSCDQPASKVEVTSPSIVTDPPNKIETETSDPKTEKEIGEVGDFLTITGDNVNVRAQSNASAKVLFQLNKGDKVKKIGESTYAESLIRLTDFWYQIEQNGKKGWVFGAFTDRKLSENSRTDDLKFEYVAFGDYYHMSFVWADEATAAGHGWKCERHGQSGDGSWDFGYGSQHCNLSGYKLDLDDEGSSNPKFEGKVFEVEWKVKMSHAWEGEGSMETFEMEVPIIVGLKLKSK